MANTAPVDGWQLNWLLSKNQLEYLLRDIAMVSSHAFQSPALQAAQYMEEILPVVSLESYYGLAEVTRPQAYKYLVTKVAMPANTLSKIVIRTVHPARIRKLTANTVAHATVLPAHSEDILGAFTMPDNQLLIVPDLPRLVTACQSHLPTTAQ